MSPTATARFAAHPVIAKAVREVYARDAETLSDMAAVTRIAAPPFGEARRAAWMARRFVELGLCDVGTDAAGNVLATVPGHGAGRPVLVAAHLDTVFPADTPLAIEWHGARLIGPGIADNGRGLAALLAIARACRSADVRTRRPVVLVATVGEEGAGDLRGVKHLFADGSRWREAAAFIAVDGAGVRRIVRRALGARRLRVELIGPGGHSWADRGMPNPIHALAEGTAALSRLSPPAHAALTVARIGGGTSVNAIPGSAWLEVDLRAEREDTLRRLEHRVRERLRRAAATTHRRPSDRPLRLRIDVIGDRPTGRTPADARVVRAARASTLHAGLRPQLVAGSTDANVPMRLGIPAIAIGAGGEAGGTHTLGEWFENTGGPLGVVRALLTVLMVAGIGRWESGC